MIKKTSAGVLIFRLQGNRPFFLLLKYTNYWGFVKGIIEDGEEEIDTIRREAKEEANLSEIEIIPGFRRKISYFFKFEGDTVSKEVVFLLGGVSNEQAAGVRISSEHQNFKWLRFEDAMRLVKHKNEKELLTEANSVIKEHLEQRRLE